MTYDAMIETIRAYNEGVENKNDALGKSEESYARLGAIREDAEYYIAVTGAPYIYSTCGGVDVDENMRVLDTEGNVIDNLYATGTDSMGVLFTNKKGYANYGGVAQSFCLVSGRIAGQDAAASIAGE